ncbi:Protein of unknown function DUF5631 [Mycobacteriaceae bacterium]
MADLPPGQWSSLLVGHQWPGSEALAILRAAAASRAGLGSDYDGYADVLRAIRTHVLDSQLGVTAESARQSFQSGETLARDVAARNLAKHQSYESAHQWITELRTDLATIADDGNTEIRRILDSTATAAEKIGALAQTVTEAQVRANTRAASCSANLCDAIHTVLITGDEPVSAREFLRTNGIDLQRAFGSPNPEFIHTQVSAIIAEQTAGTTSTSGSSVAGSTPAPAPDSLADHLADGAAAGAPLAAGAEALAAGAVNAVNGQPATPNPQPGADSLTPAVTPGSLYSGTPVLGTPVLGTPGLGTPGLGTPILSAGVAALPPVSPVAPSRMAFERPAMTGGPLPGYGADLRPPRGSAAPPPVWSAPTSAPINSAGTAGIAPTTMVRPQPASAVAAAAGAVAAGAVAGYGASRAAARNRLSRLLAAVVVQEPDLRWAVGERPDGTAVLVTDLAYGWIPPHVGIPAGVRLLEPGIRNADLTALLHDAVQLAAYDPTHARVIPADDEDRPPMSISARRTTAVEDLGWELTRATRWRPGLPRIVHTLARAGIARTGCLDSEIALLRDHLHAVGHDVLDDYPDAVAPAAVGDWQLLAAVAALIDGSPMIANYHFAWFQARVRGSEAADLR